MSTPADIARAALADYRQPSRRFPDITPLLKAAGPGMPHYLSGEAFFATLKNEVERLASVTPKDHDVLVQAFNIAFCEVSYVEPHTLVFRGTLDNGEDTSVIAHFSQCVAHVVYMPKRGPERVITGFARAPAQG